MQRLRRNQTSRFGFALRCLAATLQAYLPNNDQPHSVGGLTKLVEFTVRRQRRVVRSASGAELNGLVDSAEQLLSLQVASHQVYCGTHQSPEEIIDLF